jgi:hypothetical protein
LEDGSQVGKVPITVTGSNGKAEGQVESLRTIKPRIPSVAGTYRVNQPATKIVLLTRSMW